MKTEKRIAKREFNFPDAAEQAKRGEPGYYFTVLQTGGVSRRKYYVQFKLDADRKAVWCGGVKATNQTWERVNGIDWSKPL